MPRTSKANEEMRSEIEMSPMAILMDMRSWMIEFGTMILLTLSPMDCRKLPMSNGSLLSGDVRFVPIPAHMVEIIECVWIWIRYLYM